MNCIKCNHENHGTSKFCVKCGAKLQEQINLESNITNINGNTFNQNEGQYQNNNMNTLRNDNGIGANTFNNTANDNLNYNSTSEELETASNQHTIVENQNNNTYMQSHSNSNVYQQSINPIYSQQSSINSDKKKAVDIKTKISLILGIVSIVLVWIFSYMIIPLTIIGLILGLMSKEKSKQKKIGIILNILSIIILIILFIIGIIFSSNYQKSTFYGSGYELEYNQNWSVFEMSSGQEALQYKFQNSYLVPVGKSTLSQYTNNLNCDFSESDCKEDLYDWFYDYWSTDETSADSGKLYLYKNSDLFKILKDDIYYAKYDYENSADGSKGNFYLLVSKEKEIILSFMSITSENNMKLLNKEIMKLFKKIDIEDSNVTVVEDDSMYGALNSMSNWNRYSELRSGTLAKKSTINGGWRILDTSETYWEFKDGEFWWYESVNNLNDNYYYGTTKIEKGLDGLKSVGLGEDNLKSILSKSNGKIDQNDIYAVICTPTKLISAGEDKSSTNIHENLKLNFVWIIVDHGNEGIEGQTINLQSYGTSYFVKIKD